MTIPGLGVNEGGVTSVAVDAGHIYWTNGDVIGRANLDGSNVQSAFIPLGETTQASQVQVSGGKLYFRLRQAAIFSIGRADASGANVVLDFIPNIPLGAGLAVDAGHIYWTQGGPVPAMRSIARADLDGSHVIPRFIAAGLHGLDGLAIDAGHIYWSTFPAGRIERARIDGTRVEHGFARGVRRAHSLAVAPVTVSQ